MFMMTNVYFSLLYPMWVSCHSIPYLHPGTRLMELPLPETFPVIETEGSVPRVTSAHFS